MLQEKEIIFCNLVASFTCLHSLELVGCWFLTGKGLIKIAKNNPHLHSLNLLNNLSRSDQSAILEILEKDLICLTDLKLDIYNIEDEKMAVLDRVASSLQHLTNLTIGRMGEEEGLGPQTLGAREWRMSSAHIASRTRTSSSLSAWRTAT